MNAAPFDCWVANTIQSFGGNGAQYLQGLRRERALTFAESRADACQVGFGTSAEIFFLDFARLSKRVSANKRLKNQKPH